MGVSCGYGMEARKLNTSMGTCSRTDVAGGRLTDENTADEMHPSGQNSPTPPLLSLHIEDAVVRMRVTVAAVTALRRAHAVPAPKDFSARVIRGGLQWGFRLRCGVRGGERVVFWGAFR